MKLECQRKIIDKYLKFHGNPPLRFIAQDTGIQVTRIHRIFSGYEMKISEYEAFLKSVNGHVEDNTEFDQFVELAKTCTIKLSESALEELTNFMSRKLRAKQLLAL